MSLLTAYHDRSLAVLASDDRASVQAGNGKGWKALPGSFPKFTVCGLLLLGAVGRNDLTTRLMRGTERLVAEHSLGLREVRAQMPGILRMMWERRNSGLAAASDKLHVALLGFDSAENRIRSFVWLSDDHFEPVETTDRPEHVFFSLGAFQVEDERALVAFSDRIGREGSQKGAPWVAGQLRDAIDGLHRRYTTIGRPAFFAAIDRNGLVPLPAEFELPPARIVAVPDAPSIATAGRLYVGSIQTPRAGAPDTIGNEDGGSGAQSGMLNTLWFLQSNVATGGNGTITNAGNANDGDLTTFAQLSATGNGSTSNAAGFVLSAPPGITRRYTSATLKIRRAITANNLLPASGIAYQMAATLGSSTITTESAICGAGPVALSTLSFPLPLNANLSQASISFQILLFTGPTSGTITVKIYEAWLEIFE